MLQQDLPVRFANLPDLLIGNRMGSQRPGEHIAEFGNAKAQLQVGAEITTKNGANNDSGSRSVERRALIAGVGQSGVRGIENHQLKGISLAQLIGWNLVFSPVVLKVGDEPASFHRTFPGLVRAGCVSDPTVPPVGRYVRFRVPVRGDQVPKRRKGPRSGKDATCTDDGNWFVSGRGRFARNRSARPCTGRDFVPFIDHDVNIQAPNPERIDAGPAWMSVLEFLPGRVFRGHVKRC